MGRLLAELASKVDPRRMPFQVDDRRADLLAEDLTSAAPHPRAATAAFLVRVHAPARGEDRRLPHGHRRAEKDAITSAPDQWAIDRPVVELLRATAYLRLGEELNCHLANNRDSCLLPIRGEGVHQKREGATRAIEVLKGILDRGPRQPPGEMAAERRPHDARELPRRCPEARSHSARRLCLRVPLARLRERGEAGRCRRVWPGGRRHPRRLRQRRPARPHGVPFGLRGADALLPQPGRRHVRGPHGARRPHRGDGRPEHGPGRLRQRRLRRRAGAARRVDGARR